MFDKFLKMNAVEIEDELSDFGIHCSFSLKEGVTVESHRFSITFDTLPQAQRWLSVNVNQLIQMMLLGNPDKFFVIVDPVGIESILCLVDPVLSGVQYDVGESGLLPIVTLSNRELFENIDHIFNCIVERNKRVTDKDIQSIDSFDKFIEVYTLRDDE